MPKETLEYTNHEITVVWKPKVCIHSTICWKSLIEVFNPKERPWIKLESATTERIIEQVRQCPSGALSYYMNAEEIKDAVPDKVVAESAHIMKVEITPDGPYLIKNECVIKHSDGREERKTGTVALCRCGGSANKPYCDGSHKKKGFRG